MLHPHGGGGGVFCCTLFCARSKPGSLPLGPSCPVQGAGPGWLPMPPHPLLHCSAPVPSPCPGLCCSLGTLGSWHGQQQPHVPWRSALDPMHTAPQCANALCPNPWVCIQGWTPRPLPLTSWCPPARPTGHQEASLQRKSCPEGHKGLKEAASPTLATPCSALCPSPTLVVPGAAQCLS